MTARTAAPSATGAIAVCTAIYFLDGLIHTILGPLAPDIARSLSLGNAELRCSDETGAVMLEVVRPGRYKAFTWIFDGEHGHQWVGDRRGVGEFEKAQTIRLRPGQHLTLPQIRLDKAGGDINGTVTDEVTGEPVTQGYVSLSSFKASSLAAAR